MFLILQAVLMGIVEGITEFLPISSTGHLIIAGSFIHFSGEFAVLFDVVIQLGAILAVVYYYREKIFDSLKNLRPGQWGFKLWFLIAFACVPAAVIGFLAKDIIHEYLFSSSVVAVAMIIGAILLLLVQKHYSHYRYDHMERIGLKNALLIGLAQCLSMIPGMSRSASTIMGGMMVGLSVKAATEFSFFLAIPTMIGASGITLLDGFSMMSNVEWAALAVGFVVSFLVALVAVDKFLHFLTRHSMNIFAYYRLAVGVLMLGLVSMGVVS